MKLIKKINTSAVLASDNTDREVVVLGKGVGFCDQNETIPLSKIQRTFYNVDKRFVDLINDLPEDVLEFSSQMVDLSIGALGINPSPNLPLVLADHIAFAIKRVNEGISVTMPVSYEFAQQYPDEYQFGEFVVERIAAYFHIKFPRQEAVGIAMSFINNSIKSIDATEDGPRQQTSINHNAVDPESVLDQVMLAIEQVLDVQIDRSGYNFARFATHIAYLCQRIESGNSIHGNNSSAYDSLCKEYPLISDCVAEVEKVFLNEYNHRLDIEERLYLMLHINRISSRNIKDDPDTLQH